MPAFYGKGASVRSDKGAATLQFLPTQAAILYAATLFGQIGPVPFATPFNQAANAALGAGAELTIATVISGSLLLITKIIVRVSVAGKYTFRKQAITLFDVFLQANETREIDFAPTALYVSGVTGDLFKVRNDTAGAVDISATAFGGQPLTS